MYYSATYEGYVADNPNINFVRCDGEVFSYYEVNTASMTNNSNAITITGGQGVYPLAYIDTDKSLEITFESSQFTLDMFAMANASKITAGDFGAVETAKFEVSSAHKITIPYEVKEGSVHIRGMEETTSTATTGKFKVTITEAGEDTAGSTEVEFATGDFAEGDEIRVSYNRRVVNASMVSVSTKATTAKGSLYADWPVYTDGTNCADAARKGCLHLYLPRVRATALPGFSNSYKSASTHSVTFAAIDPKRADNKMFDLYYEPFDADGNIVTKSSASSVDWD